MIPPRHRSHKPFSVGAAFGVAGAIVILTTTLRWLAFVSFVAGTACLVMGTVARARG
jgi:hypothetical protein